MCNTLAMNYIEPLFDFLTNLKANNQKTWFEANKATYQDLRSQFSTTIKELHPLLTAFDAGLAQVEPAKCLFRINRDIRFSKDKSPYKTQFSAYLASGGSQSEMAGYYLHLEPENSFLGGGMYMPQNPALKKIRQEIDYNANEFLSIVKNPTFVHYFGEVQGEKLKNVPTGYEKDHKLAAYLKLKGFFVTHNLADQELKSKDALHHIANAFRAMYPLNEFLNKAIAHL
jgi:uncharacterized protein (TIGR02453 family)